MNTRNIECLRSFHQYQSIRDDWNDFTDRCFPENYGRSHAWLSTWWAAYHQGKPALIYIQRHPANGRIIAAAPLMIIKTMFGGFPVRMLQSLGRGIGTDDFLVGPEAAGFIPALFTDLAGNRNWHVASFHRLRSSWFLDEILRTGTRLSLSTVRVETKDYVTEFPASYAEYQQSRTRKFRRNLNQAFNRLEKEGAVSLEIFDPIVDAERVMSLGMEIARTSWQFRDGKSHFNVHGASGFYDHLAGFEQGTCGEEFNVLTVAGRPVAYLLGCRRGRSYFAVDTAYHADYRHVSAGRILFAMILKRLMEDGNVDRFDFEGDGEYKEDFANRVWNVNLCTLYNNSLYARALKTFRESTLFSRLKEIRAGKPASNMQQAPDACCERTG